VHRRLIGESSTTELALGRLTKEHPDGQDTSIRADARALEVFDGRPWREGRFPLRAGAPWARLIVVDPGIA
jgi:hypothetical protein